MSNQQANKITFSDLDIENCFKNFYLVPDYQREYVWEERQVTQLLNDIYEEFDGSNKEYFIGTTVVYKNEDGVYELIDGQQRTTTLFIMLCAFKTIYNERGENTGTIERMLKDKTVNAYGDEEDRFKLVLQYRDSTNILEQISDGKVRPADLSGSAERLHNAYEYILNFLRNTFKGTETGELKKFFVYFYRKLRFIQIESPGINDALKIFETINERGVGLNPMDLLKNLLFQQIDKDDFSRLKADWEKIIRHLEKNGEKPLRFLRYFIMANYNVKNQKGEPIIREEEIYSWLSDNANQVGYETKPFVFVSKMYENAELFTKYFQGNDKWGPNVYLDNLKRLGGGSFKQHLILLLSASHFDKNMFDYLAKSLEVLMFYYFITGEQAKNFEKNFSKWAKVLLGVQSKEELSRFVSEFIEPEIANREHIFKISFLNLNQSSVLQFRLRYILAKIAQYCDQSRLGSFNPQNLSGYITKGIEIEHILPYTPSEELKSRIGEEYDSLKIMLGNLTLLEKSINCSIGNADFYEVKAVEYAKSQFYKTKSITKIENVGSNTAINRLNQKLKEFPKWDKDTIVERQQMLFDLAKEIWKVERLN